jgi:hypothetical protein
MTFRRTDMLDHPEPVPTGLITALLARSQVRGVAVSERIGPSPRQMRELMEGRGLFSPFKLRRVAELTGVPEERIRAAQGLIADIAREVNLRPDEVRAHPRLGEVRILAVGAEITVEAPDGRIIEGVQPVSFAGPEVLDRFGLTPEDLAMPAESSHEEDRPLHSEADIKADIAPRQVDDEVIKKDDMTMSCETKLMRDDPASEPVIKADATVISETARPETARTLPRVPRELVEGLVSGSGLSRSTLSRALGRDPAFLSGVLSRGRRMPPELLEPLARACGADPVLVLAEAGIRTEPPSSDLSTGTPEGPEEILEAPCAVVIPDAGEETVQISDPVIGTGTDDGSEPLEMEEEISPPVKGAARSRAALEVIIDGALRVRVPSGFDMEAAARLIRSLTGTRRTVAGAER